MRLERRIELGAIDQLDQLICARLGISRDLIAGGNINATYYGGTTPVMITCEVTTTIPFDDFQTLLDQALQIATAATSDDGTTSSSTAGDVVGDVAGTVSDVAGDAGTVVDDTTGAVGDVVGDVSDGSSTTSSSTSGGLLGGVL